MNKTDAGKAFFEYNDAPIAVCVTRVVSALTPDQGNVSPACPPN